jgi:hypothetical protein
MERVNKMTIENYIARKTAAQYLQSGGRAREHWWKQTDMDEISFFATGFTLDVYVHRIRAMMRQSDRGLGHRFEYSGENYEGTIVISFTPDELRADPEWMAHRLEIEKALKPFRKERESELERLRRAR